MREKWYVEEVMEYFREYFEDEQNAKAFMDVVDIRLKGKKGCDFYMRMSAMRELLREFGFDVPFASQYRRKR